MPQQAIIVSALADGTIPQPMIAHRLARTVAGTHIKTFKFDATALIFIFPLHPTSCNIKTTRLPQHTAAAGSSSIYHNG